MFLTPIVLLSGLAGIVTYTRLLQGPISLERFIDPAEKGITNGLDGLSADIDDVALVLTESYGFEFQLINLTLSGRDGARVAFAPVAAVSLSVPALFTGRIVPKRINLIDPELLVTYTKHQGVSLRVATGARTPATVQSKEGDVVTTTRPDAASQSQDTAPKPARRIYLAQLFSEMNARARDGLVAHSELREIGVRNATVVLDYEGQTSEWLIAEGVVELNHHKRRSKISGAARVQSDRGPWVLSFQTVDSERTNVLRLAASVRDVVPSSIARAAPALSLFKTLDMPIGVDATMQLTEAGEIEAATLAVELAPGDVRLPELASAPLQIEGCVLNLAYDGNERRVTISPSTLKWSDSYLTVGGEVVADSGSDAGAENWAFQLASLEGGLAAEEFGVSGVKVDSWTARGRLSPHRGQLEFSEFELSAGGTQFSANGTLQSGHERSSTRVEGQLSSDNLMAMKALWPRALVPAARDWVGRHVTSGRITSGTINLLSGRFAEPAPGEFEGERISVALELSDVVMRPALGELEAKAPRALVRLEGDALEVTVPDALVGEGTESELNIKPLRLSAVRLSDRDPLGEVAFNFETSLAKLRTFAELAAPGALQTTPTALLAVNGNVDGEVKVVLPLSDDPGAAPPRISGKAKVTDVQSEQRVGKFTLKGGAFDVTANESTVDASGEILLNGVPAKINWQYIIGSEPGKQPPIRISATLDNADREQLDLDVNDIVEGDVPITLTVSLIENAPPAVHVRADLTSADLLFASFGRRKPAGRAATLDFDAAHGGDGKRFEMQNIRVVGEGTAIEGWAALDADYRMQEFYFPDFSVDTVTRLEVQGKLDGSRIWQVKAVGPTYDGRAFFGSLFSMGELHESRPPAKYPAKGMDLDARISNVIGGPEATLRQFKIKLSKRDGKLTALAADGVLDNGKKVAALLKVEAGDRKLYLESGDAGKMLKLVDFYPNMLGGRLRLEVDLDGEGAASHTGILWVENFRILGDPIASEVYASAEGNKPKKQVLRQVFEFSGLRLPFSVGHDQFVVRDSQVRGPVLGATIRGKVDYRSQRMNLSGTYIPLQGLNSALCGIPLLGTIITGSKCEGVLGITYAIQGPMSGPQVIVNPLSLVAPGIFRDIFQVSYPSVSVIPRTNGQPDVPVEKRVRASSSVATGKSGQQRNANDGVVIDGWTAKSKSAN